MKPPSEAPASGLRLHAAEALQRARKLPVGPDRNDLRQLAVGLLWLERKGLGGKVQHLVDAIAEMRGARTVT